MTSSTLSITTDWQADVAVLHLSGALDLRGVTGLLAATSEVTSAGAYSVVCDLRDLRDPPNAHLLTGFSAAQDRAGRWPRHSVLLAAPSPSLARQLARLRIDHFLSVHPSLDGALGVARTAGRAVHRTVRLPAKSYSPAMARRCLETLPAESPVEDWRDDAEMVISELASNVVRHVHRPYTVSLALGASDLLIAVGDDDRHEPVLRPVHHTSEGGRGMRLVDAVSRAWGVRLVHEDGKVVWAEVATHAA